MEAPRGVGRHRDEAPRLLAIGDRRVNLGTLDNRRRQIPSLHVSE